MPPDYDPLIAKIMTVGPDRDTAIDRMRRALDEVAVTGIQTTLPFDRALMRDPAFAAGEISTDWVAAHWDGEARRSGGPGTWPRRSRRAPPTRALAGRSSARRPTTATDPSLRKDGGGSAWRDAGRAAAVDRWPR